MDCCRGGIIMATNADRIRKMSNNQLFEFLNERGFCPYPDGCKYAHGCKKCLKNFLEREKKNDI